MQILHLLTLHQYAKDDLFFLVLLGECAHAKNFRRAYCNGEGDAHKTQGYCIGVFKTRTFTFM